MQVAAGVVIEHEDTPLQEPVTGLGVALALKALPALLPQKSVGTVTVPLGLPASVRTLAWFRLMTVPVASASSCAICRKLIGPDAGRVMVSPWTLVHLGAATEPSPLQSASQLSFHKLRI